jgi:hypothetical protein
MTPAEKCGIKVETDTDHIDAKRQERSLATFSIRPTSHYSFLIAALAF